MSAGLRTAITLGVLTLLVLVAAVWGWSALTEPFPEDEPVAICEDTTVSAGSEVRRDQVVVSVFNGSKRSGLAGATSAQLAERGFVTGDVGDSPSPAATTQIWADDPTNPAVALVQQQFKKAKVVPGEAIGVGVVVVVGEKFKNLKKKQVESVLAEADAVVGVRRRPGPHRHHGRGDDPGCERRTQAHPPASSESAGGASSGTRRALLVVRGTPVSKNRIHALGTSGGATSS